VSATDLVLERTVELPPVIVFDALIDPDLVVGWLARASIQPVLGGRYDLEWLGYETEQATSGVIVELAEPASLSVQTDDHGSIDFTLETLEGGPRGTGTLLRLRVRLAMEPAFSGRVREAWESRLDRLEELLRGHPADWVRLAGAGDAGKSESDDRSSGTPG
jgi:uncharacterized protein YndB with AHSA1/START domain